MPNIVRLSRVARLAARWGVLSPILVVAAIVTLGTDCAGIKARQVNRRAVKAQGPPKDNPKPRKGVGSVVGAPLILLELRSLQRIAFYGTLMRHQTKGEFV